MKKFLKCLLVIITALSLNISILANTSNIHNILNKTVNDYTSEELGLLNDEEFNQVMENTGFSKIATLDESLTEDLNKRIIGTEIHFVNWTPKIEVWSDGGTLYTWKVTPVLSQIATNGEPLTSAYTWVQLTCPGGNISPITTDEAYNIFHTRVFKAASLPYGTSTCYIDMKFQTVLGRGVNPIIDNCNHAITYQVQGNKIVKVAGY